MFFHVDRNLGEKMRKIGYWMLALLLGGGVMAGEFRLGRMFSDHMVLQRDRPIVIFGFADPGTAVQVRLGTDRAEATTDAQGRWEVRLPARAAGGPLELEATAGKEVRKLSDILIGDVWFCTGQSNMEWFVSRSGNAREELAAADHPQLRLLWVDRIGAMVPQNDVPWTEGWKVCTPRSVRSFSATAYYFGRELQRELGIPIGLIDSSWGGPPIRHFLPNEVEPNAGVIRQSEEALKAAQQSHPARHRAIARCLELEENPAELDRLAMAELPPEQLGTVELPGDYSKKELAGVTGWLRFRREIELPPAWAGRELELELGNLRRPDRTYFNGELVGARERLELPLSGSWDYRRRYRVPGKLVRAGKNTISMLVGDLDGLNWIGGIWGELKLYPVDQPAAAVSLAGVWESGKVLALPTPERTYGGGYNGMIYPFFRYPVRGILFYQGESDARPGEADKYLERHCRMILDYRKHWGEELPFYFVQLAAHGRTEVPPQWPVVREAQRLTPDRIPNSGMASALDIGDRVDIHPQNKQEVGRRLALQALKRTYGRSELVADGPLPDRAEFRGNSVLVRFRPTGSPLVVRGEKLTGFEVADPNGKWIPATARLEGTDAVLVEAPAGVAGITGVRYLWENCPVVTLGNRAGLPASSFLLTRTGQP